MSFSRMKPLPKAIILGIPVILIGLGVNYWLDHRPPKPPVAEALKVETTTVPAETAQPAPSTPAPVAAPPTPAPATAAAPSGLTPATNDAGLDAVLRAKK